MEEAGYNITNKEFKQISKWAENIYNIIYESEPFFNPLIFKGIFFIFTKGYVGIVIRENEEKIPLFNWIITGF